MRLRWKATLAFASVGKLNYVGLKQIAGSVNRGRVADMERYLDQPPLAIPQAGAQYGLSVRPRIYHDPYGEGQCFGSVLFHAKEYLTHGDIGRASQMFVDGAPFEAVTLQRLAVDIWQAVPARLVDPLEWRAAIYHRAVAEEAGLEIVESQSSRSLSDTLARLANLRDGVYHVEIPVYKESQGYFATHALELIKTKGVTYFFDPNKGTYELVEGDLAKVFKQYGLERDLPSGKAFTINELALKRV